MKMLQLFRRVILNNYTYDFTFFVPIEAIEGMNMLNPNETIPTNCIEHVQHPDRANACEEITWLNGGHDDIPSK
jgi:hypothetical protein